MSASHLIDCYARSFIQVAINQGYDLQTILEYSGVPVGTPADQHKQSFNFTELLMLSRQVKSLLKNQFCELTTTGGRPGFIELMLDLALSAPNLEQALNKAFRFYSVLSPNIQFTLVEEGELVAVQQEIADSSSEFCHFLSEWWTLVMWSIASWLIGEKIDCIRFEFAHAPQISEHEYALALGVPCQFFQPKARFVFRKEYLHKPVIKEAGKVDEFLFSACRFGEIPGTSEPIKLRLANFLRAYFMDHKEFPLMEYAAKQCELNSHTLRRRLSEEGASFNQIKEDVRRVVALNLLADNSKSICEISIEAGFSDTSSFSRAMKNWTGFYPSEYRSRSIEKAPARQSETEH
ncbi:MAG TPA: AraC family transcriptional regulator ligand-binding domain-containing protein [Spongiibacteraceae bacterium]